MKCQHVHFGLRDLHFFSTTPTLTVCCQMAFFFSNLIYNASTFNRDLTGATFLTALEGLSNSTEHQGCFTVDICSLCRHHTHTHTPPTYHIPYTPHITHTTQYSTYHTPHIPHRPHNTHAYPAPHTQCLRGSIYKTTFLCLIPDGFFYAS